MTSRPYKFGSFSSDGIESPHVYENVWSVEQTTGPDRVVIAPSTGHVAVLKTLSDSMREPFFLLYVLVVSRLENAPGRYQIPAPIARQELHSFLSHFSPFLEGDGRHNLWIGCEPGDDLLVYDRHNVLYAYGNLGLEQKLPLMKFKHVEGIKFPKPHTHHYNAEFDSDEAALFEYAAWKHFPLQEDDEM